MGMQVAPARVLLLGSVSAGVLTGVTTGTSQPIYIQAVDHPTIYLASQGVTSGGTVLIEEADWGDGELPYTGLWSQVSSTPALSFSTGQQAAIHLPIASYAYLRVRISSAITGGGTVSASFRFW